MRVHFHFVHNNNRTLNNNNLTSLPRDLFEPLTRLRVLRLSENKWLCDCHLSWLARYLKRHLRSGSLLSANGYVPRCHSPFALRIKAVPDLVDADFKCTGTGTPPIRFDPIRFNPIRFNPI